MRRDRHTVWLILILSLALLLRLTWVLAVPTVPISDYGDFNRIAMNVATGRGYALTAGNPTTYRPPAYPLFLAGIYALCGHSVLAARLANVLLGVATCLLTYLLATQLFDRRVGLLAALIAAGFPSHILYANLLTTENLFVPLLLGAFVAFLRAMQQNRGRGAYLVLAGFLLGLGTLTRPAILLAPAIWGIVLLWKRIRFRHILVTMSLVIVAMVATIGPWTVRNALVSGEFIPVASEGGITFLAGHNERALEGEYSLEGPVFDELFATSRTEAELDTTAYKLAFCFIRENPSTELLLLGHKFVNFFKDDVSGVEWNARSSVRSLPQWLLYGLKGVAQGYYMLVALLAIVSLFLRRHPKDRWYLLLYALFVYWTVIHLAFYGKDRFRLPLMPVLAILAAFTLQRWWDLRFRESREVQPSVHRSAGPPGPVLQENPCAFSTWSVPVPT